MKLLPVQAPTSSTVRYSPGGKFRNSRCARRSGRERKIDGSLSTERRVGENRGDGIGGVERRRSNGDPFDTSYHFPR